MVDRQAIIQELREKLPPEQKKEMAALVGRLFQRPREWVDRNYEGLALIRDVVEE